MKTARSVLLIGVLALSAANSAVATTFTPVLDEFWIVKDGTEIFRDSFNDGVLPPDGPDGANTYTVTGAAGLTSESTGTPPEGKLTMTPRLGEATVITTTYADTTTAIVRRSSTDPANANFLGQANSFEIGGLYDMSTLPEISGQSFGVRATDRAIGLGNPGNDTYSLFVGVYALGVHAGEIGVFLRSFDFTTNSSVVLWSDPIEDILGTALGETDQIELILSKDAGSDLIDASYMLYDFDLVGDPLVRTLSVSDAGPLYVGETYIRGAAIVTDRVPLPVPASLALMGLGLVGLRATGKRKM